MMPVYSDRSRANEIFMYQHLAAVTWRHARVANDVGLRLELEASARRYQDKADELERKTL